MLQGQRLFSQEQLPGINSLLSWRPEPLNLPQTQMAQGIPGQSPHPLPSPVFSCPPGTSGVPQTQQASAPAGPQNSSYPQQVKTEQQQLNWQANVSPTSMPIDAPSPQGLGVSAGPPPPQGANQAMIMAQQHSRRGSLPVLTPSRTFDLDPFALSHYYQYWHPIFPILPDGPNGLHQLLALAPAVAPWLIAAINGQLFAMPIDSQQCANDTQRAVQLMALMFIYLRTLDYTWLGAVIANALVIKNGGGGHGPRLYSIALVFDRLHSITHHYPRLISDPAAEVSPAADSAGSTSPNPKPILEPMLRELKLLELANKECFTPPPEPYEPAMAAFWWLGNVSGSPSAKSELARLLPALVDTPVAGFMRKALS